MLVATAMLEEREAGEGGQPFDQLVLECRVTGFWRRILSLPVVPVAAAHGCGRVVADGEPCLGEIAHFQIVGRRGAAHLGRDPARIDGVAEYVRPSTREGERERDDVELALGVRLRGVPGPRGPVDVPQGSGTAVMHPAAEVDEPIRAVDQRGEHVGRQGIHRESLRVPLGGRGAGWLEEDGGLVDDSVHPADLVHLIGELSGLRCAAEVADDRSRGTRGEVAERRRPLASAGVQDNVMTATDEDASGSTTKPVGGAADEDTRHRLILPPAPLRAAPGQAATVAVGWRRGASAVLQAMTWSRRVSSAALL